VGYLLGAGRSLLSPDGELRAVVITDLAPVVEHLARERGWPLQRIATGPRHVVFALPPATSADEPLGSERVYARDEVQVAGLSLFRPHDLGGDEPQRLSVGLPLLLEMLPRRPVASALCWPAGYGALPLSLARRPEKPRVVTWDRDLLATTFTRLNAARDAAGRGPVEVREAVGVSGALREGERFEVCVAELAPAAGERVAEADLVAATAALVPGGQALVLAPGKLARDWVADISARRRLGFTSLAVREGHGVFSMTRR